ncbi:molybdate ABC transporter substrate-binding protein [Humitalea sp. 24SJ18S-53]|uniref:molybdate ABC transporter substrate-binding protein n=1 Tax=Humitalea sp. 24SJ18S-53 TaxID=3422307 RepID=UPI003D668205
MTIPPLRIIGTGAVETPLMQTAEAWARETGRGTEITILNGGSAAAKVRGGAPVDLVVNAMVTLDGLIADGHLDGATRAEVARVRVGIGLRDGDPVPDLSTPEALRAAILAAGAISHSDPAAGASTGLHMVAMLRDLGVTAAMAGRIQVYGRGIKAVEAVRDGIADMALTQSSEIKAVPGVTLVAPLPEAVGLVTTYVGAVATQATDPAGAAALLAMLRDATGQARFVTAGLETVA